MFCFKKIIFISRQPYIKNDTFEPEVEKMLFQLKDELKAH